MNLKKQCALFALGGTGYVALELIWRGRSHYSMFLAGGVCFLLLGRLNRKLPGPVRAVLGAGIITLVELTAGLIVNRSYTVWDYRDRPGNFLGQICPLYSLLWIPVAAAAQGIYHRAEGWLQREGRDEELTMDN